MSNKTKKYIWPVSLAMSLALVGVLTALVVFTATTPANAQAHNPPCNNPAFTFDQFLDCVADEEDPLHNHEDDVNVNCNGNDNGNGNGAMLDSSSSTGSAAVKLTLTIDLEQNLTGSSWVEIYLEDDYQEPGSIAKENVIFEARGDPTTGGSGVDVDTTFAAAAVEIDDGGTILNPDGDDDEDVVVISARIPDMKDGDATGYPKAGQTLIMVVSDAAGIKNPSEAGSHSVGYSIIGGTDDRADEAEMKLTDLPTLAKISLSDDDGGRGKEVTITGTGFNNGTTAEAFVLPVDSDMDGEVSDAEFWNALNCYEMNHGRGPNGRRHGRRRRRLLSDVRRPVLQRKAIVDGLDYTKGDPGEALCSAIVRSGDSLGTVNVGSDDKFAIAFTVHQDEFEAGQCELHLR